MAASVSPLTLLLNSYAEAQNAPKPNVLFIIADDLNRSLGTYGNKIVRSPNIDAIAKQGMRFDYAFCNATSCIPSRTAILTGRRPETTKVFGPTGITNFRESVPDAVTLPDYFRQNGYTTAYVGKVFDGRTKGDPRAWDISLNTGKMWGAELEHLIDERQEIIDVIKRWRKKGHRFYTYWGAADCPDEQTGDGKRARAAARFIEENKRTPFFLAVGFVKPHIPYPAPKKYYDLYSPADIPLDDSPLFDSVDRKVWDLGLKNAVNSRKGLITNREVRRRAICAYYACVSLMDAQVGLVLDALKKSGLADNTIVVFMSDQGYSLGDHGIWGKSNLYEDTVRAPLIIAAPNVTPPGSPARALVEFVDIYPTLAALCGLPPPEDLEGTSFVPLIKDPGRKWKKAVVSVTNNKHRMARTEKWKLMEGPNGKDAALFDLENDPKEANDVSSLPEHQEVLDQMRNILRQGWRSVLPE